MDRLYKLQLRNLLHSRYFYICGTFTLIAPLIFFFIRTKIPQESTTIADEAISGLQGMGSLIMIIIVVLFVCQEFEDGTAKNIIARGYSRRQLLITKYLVSLFGILIISVLSAVISSILSLNQPVGDLEKFLLFLPAFLVTTAASVSLYTAIAYYLESKGASITACLITPNVISLILLFIQTHFKIKTNLSNYWVEGLIGLIDLNHITITSLVKVGIVSLIYIIGLLGITVFLTRKKEVK